MPPVTTLDELNESLRAEQASIDRLFGGDRAIPKVNHQKLIEGITFINEVKSGKRPYHHFKEAMTRSDFPIIFGDIMNRVMLGRWAEWPVTWPEIARRTVVPDFRTVGRVALEADDRGLSPVPERSEYPETSFSEFADEYKVKKYGKRVSITWEMGVDDDLNAFDNLPQELAIDARQAEEIFVTELYVDANGPHASLYTAANNNIVPGNPPLSLQGLQTAFTALADMRGPDGRPIVMRMVKLVVPPALEIVANNILNAIEIRVATGGGGVSASDQLVAQNWMRNRVQLVVNPYIPYVATTANGSTSWFLFAEPSNPRPALEFGLLRGHEQPQLFQRMGNNQRVGGGVVPESFETDSIDYRVRHVFGGGRLQNTGGYRTTVASNGTGES